MHHDPQLELCLFLSLLLFSSSSVFSAMSCTTDCSWGDGNKHLLTPERKLIIDQSKNTTKAQLGEPMSFISYLQKYGWRITGRSRNESKITQHPNPIWVTAHKSRKPGAHCPTCRQFCWSEPLFSSQASLCLWSADLRVFEAVQLVQDHLSAVIKAYISLGKKGPSESGLFQGLLEAFERFTSWA